MTTDIKAAIAGAIEKIEERVQKQSALLFATEIEHIRHFMKPIEEALAALRRIEFVDGEYFKNIAPMDEKSDTCSAFCSGWMSAIEQLKNTGHAIVKMGE